MKSYGLKSASYAKGGPVIGKTSEFIKTPDKFRDSQFKSKTSEDYGGSSAGLGPGKTKAPAAKDKSLKAIKPHG